MKVYQIVIHMSHEQEKMNRKAKAGQRVKEVLD
jgi:hypothetical protein